MKHNRDLAVLSFLLVSNYAFGIEFLASDGAKLYRADLNGNVSSAMTLSAAVQSLTRLSVGYSLPGAAAGDIIACGVTATSGRYSLYRLDDPNGTPTLALIGSVNKGVGSLVFANGKMYGVEDSESPIRVYEFDMVTGNFSVVHNTGIAATGSGGLAFDNLSGNFYITDSTQHRLFQWVPGNTATQVGPVGFNFSNNGLEMLDGVLYGVVRRDSPANQGAIGTFNLQTGAFTTVTTIPSIVGGGTGFVAVPEPASLSALALGVLAVVRRKKAKGLRRTSPR